MLTKEFHSKIDKLIEELRSKGVKNAVIKTPIAPEPKPKGKKRVMRKTPTGKWVRKDF